MANPVQNFGETAKGLARNPLGIIALFIVLIYGLACLVVGTGKLESSERLPMIWFLVMFPVIVLGVFTWLMAYHHHKFYSPEDVGADRFVAMIPTILKAPDKGEQVTENHLALVHSSWRYAKKDSEFKKDMYAFHVIVQGNEEVLDRIEYVKYSLHPTYPNPNQVVTDRKSHFKLKELAWGESNVRAEVKIKGQEQTIKLNRYINLTQTGPNI